MRKLLVCAAILLTGGCATATETLPARGTYFEIEYVNFAWAPTWKGAVIDSTGAIRTWDLEGRRWAHEEDSIVSGAALREKWQQNAQASGTIPVDTFRAWTLLVPQADVPLTEAVHRCADAGAVRYSAWRFVPERDGFRRIVLRQEGDVARESTSERGRLLGERLAQLGLFRGPEGCRP